MPRSQLQRRGGVSFQKAADIVSNFNNTQGASSVALAMVSQSAGQAVQNATAYLESVSVVAATGVAYSIEQMVSTGSTTPWKDIIDTCQNTVDTAAATFATIGGDAAEVLEDFGG